MEKEADKGYTLTVRLKPAMQRKLAAHAHRHGLSLTGAVRCWLMSLPEEGEKPKKEKPS